MDFCEFWTSMGPRLHTISALPLRVGFPMTEIPEDAMELLMPGDPVMPSCLLRVQIWSLQHLGSNGGVATD